MEYIATTLVIIVALEHVYIMVLEMFMWERPRTRKMFGVSKEKAVITKTFAANQGLYNGFLAAGLLFGLLYSDAMAGLHIQLFFLSCIIVAAIYGAITVKKSILIMQGLPAILASLFILGLIF